MEQIMGIDMATWIQVGSEMGCQWDVLMILLPFIESGILSGIAETQNNG